ncbi:MAG: hypothetical protein Q4G70_04795 [Pseudomonadota bacterium]|nr:hypothetical protein [Pseudomonadota bacterium]
MSFIRRLLATACVVGAAAAQVALAAGPATPQPFVGKWTYVDGMHFQIEPAGKAQMVVQSAQQAYQWRAEAGGAWLVLTAPDIPALACLQDGKLMVYLFDEKGFAAASAALSKAVCGADIDGERALVFTRG